MSRMLKTTVLATTMIGLVGATAVEAAPLTVASPSTVVGAGASGAGLEQVAYRRYYGGGRYYGRRYGYNPAGAAVAGAALGLIGAGVAAAAAPSYGYGYGYGYPAYGYGYGYPAYGYGW